MAKQLNVNLSFTADTSQAAAQVRNLQQSLTQLVNQPVGIGERLSADILKATQAAAELKMHLQNATNIDTGTLDFGKLNQSLKASGVTLQQYATQLQSLGPQGQQTFMQLARSVANAEVPLRRSNTLLAQFSTTLANTARWQLSSTMLHGFISAVSTAWNYSKDLNESLNNIRIVTGYNIDQMSKFADQANRAAKALSTTTTEYTNASLIYYQQGLSDSEVLSRTETTIKMANVSRQSAETVSDQMTAIWNNFYDGSKSLEYYADVVTALGAATASSSEEIAQGLEKFAAVADTVGLSYEYATAALATVTATTRQSADVVGTAFKTLFARLSDLKLGETLDDGTTLGSYSENLAKIGVNIKDASGQLKDMDTILNETAAKWDNLDKAQQVALAKGVAGIRQYTQFIALMDNWDFMEENLNTVNSSQGTLEKQAKIYEESWEAASKRVKASLETIYASIMDDEFFIDLTNGFAGLVDKVGGFVKSIGGLKGVLFGLGTILTKVFAEQMAQGFQNLYYNIQMSSEAGKKAIQDMKIGQMRDFADSMLNYETSTVTGKTAKQIYSEELVMQQQLAEKADQITTAEQQKCKFLIEQHRIMGEQSMEIAKQLEMTKERVATDRTDLMGTGLNNGQHMDSVVKALDRAKGRANAMVEVRDILKSVGTTAEISKEQIDNLSKKLGEAGVRKGDITQLSNALKSASGDSTAMGVAIEKVNGHLSEATLRTSQVIARVLGIRQGTPEFERLASRVAQYMNNTQQATMQQNQLDNALQNGKDMGDQFSDTLDKMGNKAKTASQLLSTVVSGIMSLGMLVSSITGLVDTLEDPDTTGWEKFGRILTSISMIAMSVMGTFAGMKAAYDLVTSGVIKNTAAKIINAYASHLEEKQSQKTSAAQDIEEKETRETTAEINKNTAAKIANQAADNKMQFKGKNGKIRTYSGKKNHKGQLLDDDGQIISNKYIDKYKLNDFGKAPVDGGGGQVPNKLPKKSLLKPGALKTVGKAAGGAAIIVAAIAAAAFIAKTASDYYNRFEIEAKKAEETAKAVQKTYEEVQNAESEFRSNMDSYESAVDGLDELTKGTEEYKKAVVEANNAAVKLLNTHKNLKYIINEDGLIEIDQASLLAAQRESLQKEARAQAAAMSADQEAENARLEADKVNFQRTQMKAGGPHWDADDTTAVAGGVGAGAALAGGAVAYTAIAASNVWNPVGWAMLIAGAVAAVIGVGIAAFNNDADVREAQTLDALKEFSTTNGGRDLTSEEIKKIADEKDSSGKLAESLLQDVDATNDMIAEMRANTEAIKRNNELIANQLLQNNDLIVGSDYYDDIVERSGAVYGKAYENALRTTEASGWGKDGIAQIDGANDEAKKVWNDYLKYAGLEGRGLQLIDTTGTDDNRIFVYLDEQGQRQEKTLAEMQKARAAWVASNQTEANAVKLISYFKEWSNKEGAANQGIANFLMNGNFENATKSEVEGIEKEINENYNGDQKAYLESKLGDLNIAASELGYKNADALVEAFKQGLIDIDKAWGDIDFHGISAEVQKNVQISSAQALDNLVAQMNAGQLGEEAGMIFTEGLNNILSQMSPEDQEKALGQIMNIDWSQWDAGYQIVDIVAGLGYELDTTTEAFANWVTQVNIANGAMFDYAKAVENIGRMQELVNDLEIGDIISKEDYDMLVKYNNEVERYFRILGDGSYKLVGDPLDAIQAIGKGIDKAYGDAVIGAQANYDTTHFRHTVQGRVEATGYSRKELGGDTWGVTGSYTPYEGPDWTDYVAAWLIGAPAGDFSVSYGEARMQDVMKPDGGNYGDPIDTYGIANQELYNAQIDFIDRWMQDYTDEQIAAWKNVDPNSDQAKEYSAEVAGIISNYLASYPELSDGDIAGANNDLLEAQAKQLSAELEYATSARSAKELDKMYAQEQIGEQAYNSAQLEFAQQEKWEGMDPNEVEEYADALMNAAKSSDLLDDNMNEEAAEDVALYIKKMNQGVKKLQDGFEEWNSILDKSDKGSEEYINAMNNMKDAMSDVLGVNEDFISDKFILDHLKDIEKAATGDAKAIDDLSAALGKEIIYDITVDGSEAEKAALEAHANLQTKLAGKQVGFSITADMDTEGIIAGAQEVINSAEMTVAEAQAYFNSLGYEPVFATEEKDVDQSVPITITRTEEIDPFTDSQGKTWSQVRSYTYQDGVAKTTGKMEVVAMSSDGKTPKIKELRKKSSGAMNNFSSANKGGKSGGGGGSPKKADKKKKSDIVDRYKEITDSLNRNTQAINETSGALDRLYGNTRIAQMEKVNALIKKEIELNNIKRKEALKYLSEDKKALDQAAKEAGIQFVYDELGNIRNYTDQMTALYDALDAAISHANADGNADENEKEVIDSIQEKIDAVKDAQTSYEETLQVLQEIDQTIIDKFNEWQDNNFEQLNLKIEMAIELNENDMALLEYKLSEIEDDTYSAAEALSLMWGGKDGNQMDIYLNNLTTYKDSIDELNALYNNSKISHAKFIEGLQSSSDSILSELQNIQSLDKTMQEYYSNTLANVNSEIEKYTNLMDNANSALEHFSSMMELLGKQTDYEAMGIILSAQAQVAQDKYEVSARTYKMFADEAAEKKQAYVNALADPAIGKYGLKQLESEWLAAEEAAAEAQDQMLSDAEAWGEALGAILDNALAKFAQKLEKALTGEFGSFDNLSTQLERANSLQEEYLTTTNKIYETNKLMRQAQNEIDKTTNTVAKQKLKQFINETNQMQQQGELSQYELEIQQAKYDLLLAEIALREAQNAKSTVRLQRDSEGNFGYVYTADQQAVADAQQKFEDAQNSLYNKGLEGANDYAQKSIEIQQEATEAMTEIAEKHRNGEYQSEAEYQAALESAQQYYYEKLQQYAHLYQVAVTTDSRVVADAWSSDFASMVDSADSWRQHVGDYISDINGAFGEYSKVMDKLREQTVGKDLTELAAKTAQLAKNSEELATKLLSEKGVINALDQELSLVGQVTQAYAEQRDALMAMVAEYKEYLRLLGIEIRTQSDRTDVLETGMQVTVKSGVKNWAKTDSSTLGSVLANGEYKVLQYTNDEVQISNSAGSTGWVKKTDLVGFDTGGYTGSWGSYGKLAMLHEKEMVLNKQDTENLLASMEFLNRILEMIDLQALSNQLGGILTMPSLSHHNSEILEQNVHIEASFPGVSDRNEIEEAFNNLINTASQYANRR